MKVLQAGDIQANYAVGEPNTGPAFRSTGFRPGTFAIEASICWEDFSNVLEAIPEDDNLDLEAQSLQLLSLKELVQQHAARPFLQQHAETEQSKPSALEPEARRPRQKQAYDQAEAAVAQPDLSPKSAAKATKAAQNATDQGRDLSATIKETLAAGLTEEDFAFQSVALRRAKRSCTQQPVKAPHVPQQQGTASKKKRKQKMPVIEAPPESQESSEVSSESEDDEEDKTFRPKVMTKKRRTDQSTLPSTAAGSSAQEGSLQNQDIPKGSRVKYQKQYKVDPNLKGLSDMLQNARQPEKPRRGRYKTEADEKTSGKQTKFEGESRTIEVERREAFLKSAKVLKSVQKALQARKDYVVPFQVRTEGHEVTKMRSGAKAPHGPQMCPDNILLRIEIRMYDQIHYPLQVFLVPGNQKLIELRKAIVCPADRNMAAVKMSKKAAFFYIEGTFFIDKRSRATDLVKPIKQFCAQQGIPIPPEIGEDRAEAMPERMEDLEVEADMESESAPRQFQEIDMSKATWADIGLRAGPGARNVFCHQGCCEHLMVIKDVRRVHPDDPQHLSAYPLIIQEEQARLRSCNICLNKVAQKLTYDDQCAPETPTFWCFECYKLMHYDEEDNLLYEHKVFDYQGG